MEGQTPGRRPRATHRHDHQKGRTCVLLAALAGISSGILAQAAFPPMDLGPVAFFALVPLALLFRRGRPLQVALGSLMFSLSFFGLLLSWIGAASVPGYIATILALSPFILVFLQLGMRSRNHLPEWSHWLIFPIFFLGAEYLRSNFPLGGFAWGALGYSQHDNAVMLRLAPYTGSWGIMFLLLLVNSAVAEAIRALARRGAKRTAAKYAIAAIVLTLFPAVLPRPSSPDGQRARLAMVQGNVPEGTIDPHSDDPLVLQNHIRLSRPLASNPPSLVVWAEGSLDNDPFFNPAVEDALLAAIREVRAPFLVGGWSRHPDGRNQNASLFFDEVATLQDIYIKRKLVPFGEWVPMRRTLEPLVRRMGPLPTADLKAGARATVFSLFEGRFGSLICYESTFPRLARSLVQNGARLLVVSTNNSSYERTAASEQHLIFSQLRAAEHRMWVAHTGLSGISAVVDPEGRILEKSRLFEPKVLRPTVRFATGMTPYARWGDWIVIAAFSIFAGLVLLSLFRPDGVSPLRDQRGEAQRSLVRQANGDF